MVKEIKLAMPCHGKVITEEYSNYWEVNWVNWDQNGGEGTEINMFIEDIKKNIL